MDKKNKLVGSIIIVVGCTIFLIVGYFLSKPKVFNNEDVFLDNNISSSKNKNQVILEDKSGNGKTDKKMNTEEFKKIVVEIKGEVKNPNVYTMEYESRIYDLVEKAGGFTEKADKMSINCSMKLKDEDCIVVYGKGETPNSNAVNNKDSLNRKSSTAAKSDKIDINTASKEELKTLPGVGDVTAEKIIDYREENGGFKSIDELTKVNRIGPKTLEKFREKIEAR
ncbi:MAG: helix-hairpin-helix domain-containing protein [Clostridium sp.]|nr:helix-hairpin-helix domain-containing protein [Clostridium sp.]